MTEENKPPAQSGEINYYTDSKGTGALSSLVFIIFAIIVMVIISHFVG